MTEQQLVDLKRKIDQTKQKQSELKGKRKALLETLQTTFSCKTIPEAIEVAEEFGREAKKLDAEIQKGMKQIEEEYEF